MSKNRSGKCWNCGSTIDALDFGRADTCPQCGRDTRACKNCNFYDPTYNNHCKENQADRVVEKERSNFCDYFVPTDQNGGTSASKESTLSAAEALFKKK